MAHQQRIVYFSGTVQGVGFRFTTVRVAGGYDVTGTVRNLPDGRVEVVAEGETEEIDRFLEDLTRRMGRYIRRRDEQTAEPTGKYRDFSVSF
ncbi:MAG: acylphosphatase [Phycisphaerae bacterium]